MTWYGLPSSFVSNLKLANAYFASRGNSHIPLADRGLSVSKTHCCCKYFQLEIQELRQISNLVINHGLIVETSFQAQQIHLDLHHLIFLVPYLFDWISGPCSPRLVAGFCKTRSGMAPSRGNGCCWKLLVGSFKLQTHEICFCFTQLSTFRLYHTQVSLPNQVLNVLTWHHWSIFTYLQ